MSVAVKKNSKSLLAILVQCMVRMTAGQHTGNYIVISGAQAFRTSCWLGLGGGKGPGAPFPMVPRPEPEFMRKWRVDCGGMNYGPMLCTLLGRMWGAAAETVSCFREARS